MRRDIQVNYGNLEVFADMLSGYLGALDDMRDAVVSIDELLEGSTGQAVAELRACKDDVLAAIDTLSAQASDATEILCLYIRDMTAILRPIGWGVATRADSNDTYWNITHMSWANSIQANLGVYYGAQDSGSLSYNQGITAQIRAEATALTSRIDTYLGEMWSLHKLVADYEQADDAYAAQAGKLYDSYTSGWERTADILGGAGGFVTGLVQGLFDGASSLVIGLFDLVGNVLCYIGSGAAVGACSLFGATPPAWASEYFDEANATIDALLTDPFLIVEGMGQGTGDSFDSRGIAFGIGALVPELIGPKGLGRVAGAGKLADDAADAGRIADDAADAGKLADNAADAGRLADNAADVAADAYRARVIGGGHGGAVHKEAINREIEQWANNPEVAEVYGNRGLTTAGLEGGYRPDIIVKFNDGSVTVIEYASPSQKTGWKTYYALQRKLETIKEINPETKITTELHDWGSYE